MLACTTILKQKLMICHNIFWPQNFGPALNHFNGRNYLADVIKTSQIQD